MSAITASYANTCAVAGTGVHCWGANDEGQLGTGTTADQSETPVEIPGLSDANGVSAGGARLCEQPEQGRGRARRGQLLGRRGAGPARQRKVGSSKTRFPSPGSPM